jgi:hypothetical protein
MARLKDRMTEPPGGWTYTQFETGHRMRGENETDLVNMIISHRQWKGLQPVDFPTVKAEVERQICLGQERAICMPEPGEDFRPLQDLMHVPTIGKIMSFSRGVFAYFEQGGGYADDAEINRRAQICRGCKFNRPAKGCSCDPLYKLINHLIPAHLRKQGLHICGLCGCSLQAKCAMPAEVVAASNKGSGLRVPEWCWQRGLNADT